MGTAGLYGVVKDDHYYLCYEHSDMYPDGYPAELVGEAAEIAARGDWQDIIDGWTAKAWLDESLDSDVSPDAREHVRHADGDTYQNQDRWVYGMRPRLNRQEMIDDGRDWMERLASRIYGPEESCGDVPYSKPGWQRGAEMPYMMKSNIKDHMYTLTVIDADHNEIVCCNVQNDHFEPIAAASLDDVDELRKMQNQVQNGSSQMRFQKGKTTSRDWSCAYDEIADGQWRRPNGPFPPLPGTPEDYPAQHYAEWPSEPIDLDSSIANEVMMRQIADERSQAETAAQKRKRRYSKAEQKSLAFKALRDGVQKVATESEVSASTLYSWQRKFGMR